jgi:hypothetical protein
VRLVIDRKFVCLFGVNARHDVPHEHDNNSIACVGNKATVLGQHQGQCSRNIKTRRRKRQEAAESHGHTKPLTREEADETSQVDTSWLKDVAPLNIPDCEQRRQCRSSGGHVLFQIIMARVVIMML